LARSSNIFWQPLNQQLLQPLTKRVVTLTSAS
jgi:hypothetical protein